MAVTGRMIAEGLRPGAEFAPPHTRIVKVLRVDVGDSAGPGQPRFWTIIDFAADDADAVATALAETLDPRRRLVCRPSGRRRPRGGVRAQGVPLRPGRPRDV
ncbi:hypothetical protein [Paractinoplanes lichenicola]|uniref:Uncharacterized protein n=1 Tax=Paractinoplanes lichenicola TaxID=2802976 RepID=A0ABS1VZ98_9ACTN|nr:hypothetical protein [Actinoplanes lichenicola]MBL7259623.1 hypothetical protein [Actinoplanes lichenicola]